VTNRRQTEKYEGRTQLCLYLAGGLGGIALFAAADNVFLATTHPVFGAVLLSLGLLAGGALGMAYSGYRWELTRLRRRIEDGLDGSAEYDRTVQPPNSQYEFLYRAGTILVAVTGAWLVLAAWLSVAIGSPAHAPSSRCSHTGPAQPGVPQPARRGVHAPSPTAIERC
jgi:hypothetical protein